jgi:hypothetical protein
MADRIKLAEEWLLRPENNIGQELKHREYLKGEPICGNGITNPACELCRLSIMLPAYAQHYVKQHEPLPDGYEDDFKYTDKELLNWAMAQLRRAARVMDLIAIMVEGDNKRAINTIYAPGLDLCADTIEKHL